MERVRNVCTGCPNKEYSRLTNYQTVAFCPIAKRFLDSKYLFIDLDFNTSTSQIG